MRTNYGCPGDTKSACSRRRFSRAIVGRLSYYSSFLTMSVYLSNTLMFYFMLCDCKFQIRVNKVHDNKEDDEV